MTTREKLTTVTRCCVFSSLILVLAGCGTYSVVVTAAEVQAALALVMPLKSNGIVIKSPKVQLGDPEGGIQVCSRWELAPSPLAGLLHLRGDVCGAGKLRWDRPSCQVKLDTPSLTKASLDSASQLPQRILEPLNSLLTQSLQGVNLYQANGIVCSLVKGIRTTATQIEILI